VFPEDGGDDRMKFEGSSTFARVIEEHLDLKRKNADLDGDMTIGKYLNGDDLENHPLFKTEEQARIEETISGTQPALDRELVLALPNGQPSDPDEESLWGRTREFDWGD
jgi:hypothetical protein